MENSNRKTVNLLIAFMLRRGAESWRANFLANKLTKAFGESAFGVIGAYLSAEWSFIDIYMLDQICTKWRKDPRRPLQLERLLLELGFFPVIARKLSWQYAIYCTDHDRLRSAVQTLLKLGIRHNALFEHLMRHPDSLALPQESILSWSRNVVREGKPLEWRLNRLPRIRMAEFNLEPVESDWNATDIRVIYADEIATIDPTSPPPTEAPKRRTQWAGTKYRPSTIQTDQPIIASGAKPTDRETQVPEDEESPESVALPETAIDANIEDPATDVERPREEAAVITSSEPEFAEASSSDEEASNFSLQDEDAYDQELGDADDEGHDPLPGTVPIGGLQDFAELSFQPVDYDKEEEPEADAISEPPVASTIHGAVTIQAGTNEAGKNSRMRPRG